MSNIKTLNFVTAALFAFVLSSCETEKDPYGDLAKDMCADLNESVQQVTPKRMEMLFTDKKLFEKHKEEVEELKAEKKAIFPEYSDNQLRKIIGIHNAHLLVDNCDAVDKLTNRVYGECPAENPVLVKVKEMTEDFLNGKVVNMGLGYNQLMEDYSNFIIKNMLSEDEFGDMITHVYGEDKMKLLNEYEVYLLYQCKPYVKLVFGKLVEVND